MRLEEAKHLGLFSVIDFSYCKILKTNKTRNRKHTLNNASITKSVEARPN